MGEAYNVNKETIHITPKSTNKSRVQYCPEPTRGQEYSVYNRFIYYISQHISKSKSVIPYNEHIQGINRNTNVRKFTP